ncbi:hypothetical protein [Nocardia sp. alder85J]|uniref:DUF7832 domain-containing protein n=1 Tax=Nocardia sp. alder85J TaxID=2862949 RepID=UPI001CD7C11C|nr:hypothetical protein [Nocardia sp. alder85J]MCX4095813.1 hypothetical protein [Nocardia sp. alder85J]
MTYDDAGWHDDAMAELDLPCEAAGTHIGMFMAWLTLHDLVDSEFAATGSALRDRSTTPGRYLIDHCARELNSSMLTDAGKEFTAWAYELYYRAYPSIPAVAALESIYHAPDSWETYDTVAVEIDRLYLEWQQQRGDSSEG